MTIDKFLERRIAANPALGNTGARMTLTVESFLDELRLAYAVGHREWQDQYEAAEPFAADKVESFDFTELFGSLFQGGRKPC